MNAYYENANIRYNDKARAHNTAAHLPCDRLISFICAIVAMVTCPAAIAIEKTALIFSLFISFGAVVGAIEAGSVSMLLGIVICGGISLFEYALLKSLFKNAKKAKQGSASSKA